MSEPNPSDPQRMSCMEIWGGNQAIDKYFEAPGVDIYVHSEPFQQDESGGDIYYLTSCASGRISRFLLADVSGHGDAAAGLARSLRDLLRQNVNKISQERFVVQMNQEFGRLSGEAGFATAIVATFFEPSRSLDISVAGHPFPFYFRSDQSQWVYLDPARRAAGFENMPLGVVDETNYPGRKLNTKAGDMFLLYTDAFVESFSDEVNESMLGVNGVLEILNSHVKVSPNEIIPLLRREIGSLAASNLVEDDASLILGHFTQTKVRLRDNLLAPIRLLGRVGDQTDLDQ